MSSARVQALENLTAPEFLETRRTLDGLDRPVAFFVKVEAAVGAIEVGSQIASDVLFIFLALAHANARL
jgi:hypothetical protein